jgi:valyl-tRNA synthetase
MEVTRTVRYLRSEVQLPPGKKVNVILQASDETAAALQAGLATLKRLAAIGEAEIVSELPEKPKQALTAVVPGVDIFLPLAGVVDLSQELHRLEKELNKLDGELNRSRHKLANQGFLAKAPDEVVAVEQAKAQEYAKLREKVLARIENLK